MKLRHPIIGIVLLFASLFAPVLKAQDGLRGALSRGLGSAHTLAKLSPQIAAADFDNDQKPDGAILLETGSLLNGKRAFRIELHVTAGNNNAIIFSSAEGGLAIAALDVNEDGAPDIVVERAFTRQRVQVFLNDGHGTFHQARTEDYPSPDPSSPDWRAELTWGYPAFCLPAPRSSEHGAQRQVSIVYLDPSVNVAYWAGTLLVDSAARAPSSSRGPPRLLSL